MPLTTRCANPSCRKLDLTSEMFVVVIASPIHETYLDYLCFDCYEDKTNFNKIFFYPQNNEQKINNTSSAESNVPSHGLR